MIKRILWIWQLPQNIIGFILSSKAEKVIDGEKVYYLKALNNNKRMDYGVSLGNYIIFDKEICLYSEDFIQKCINHEWGHHLQSLYLGWLYLLIIGLPSAIGNTLSRIFRWTDRKYYSQPWEKWADKLGHVDRF